MATKEVVVRVRCSEAERRVWGRSADAVRLSLSEWVRGRLNARVEEIPGSVSSQSQRRLLEENDAERLNARPFAKRPFKPDFK